VTDSWKLPDAKARFAEVVRRARSGKPQRIRLTGEGAVLVVDPERFDVRPKPRKEETLAGFIERSRKYRGAPLSVRRFKVFPFNRVYQLNEDAQ
jgi:prevent-host-death family protein